MKRNFLLILGIVMMTSTLYSQSAYTRIETFDESTVNYTPNSPAAWGKDMSYYTSPPAAFRGTVPNMTGGINILESPVYDFSTYSHILLRFKHICKISPRDIVRVEYKMGGQVWQPLPLTTYAGRAGNYATTGFNANSYPEWLSNDSIAQPMQSWWKEEVFHAGFEVAFANAVQFRFVIEHGVTSGTQIAYGWLLDDIEVIATTSNVIPPVVELLSPFRKDTLNSVGPWEVNAKIKSQSAVGLETPFLKYTATHQGTVIKSDSIQIKRISGDSLWRISIPQLIAGTDVFYSIKGEDSLGNYTKTTSWYYIQKPTGNIYGDYSVGSIELELGDTTFIAPSIPLVVKIKNRGDSILTAATINYSINGSAPQSFNWTGNLPWDFSEQEYITGYVPKLNGYDTIRVWTSIPGKVDTVAANDTLTRIVYGASLISMEFVNQPTDTVNHTGPFTIHARIGGPDGTGLSTVSLTVITIHNTTPTFDTLPMTFDASDNLWKTSLPHTPFGSKVVYFIEQVDVFGNIIIIVDNFYIEKDQQGAINVPSVALDAINSPSTVEMVTRAPIPIQVTIRNKGTVDLTSCVLNWTLNGVLQIPSFTWSGNSLPDDFTDTATIGSYTPSSAQNDTIEVWVSMPNGVADVFLDDDTMQIISLGCPGPLTGTRTVGVGRDFPTIKAAIDVLRGCEMTQDLTLQLKGIFPENVDLQELIPVMNGYRLTITSLDNHPDSAVIQPSSGTGIALGKTNNITLKNITVNARSGNRAIEFTNACTNVVIRDCSLLLDSLTSSTVYGIRKGETSIVDSIFIIHNQISGGLEGIRFVAGTASIYGKHVVIDSNMINSQRNYGIFCENTELTSCAYNTVLTRSINTYNTWEGIHIVYSNGNIIGNRVIQRSTIMNSPTGISVQYYNTSNTTDTGLIANNEVMTWTTGDYQGLLVRTSRAKILHNSIYVAGSGASKGIRIWDNANNVLIIKNNNVIMQSTGGFPVYLNNIANLQNYDIDYNNMYAPTYVGFAGVNRVTMAEWQEIITTDKHSVCTPPDNIANLSSRLEPSSPLGLLCAPSPFVNQDIENKARTGAMAIMGCYEVDAAMLNGSLLSITGLQDGNMQPTDMVNVAVSNTGTSPLTSISLGWSINDVLQSNNVVFLFNPDPLPYGQSATLPLGQLGTVTGDITVKVWINNLNGGNPGDAFVEDDTVKASYFICAGNYNGRYTVGATGDFIDMTDVLNRMNMCGVSGDIILAFETGTYSNIDLTNSADLFGSYSLTITSASGTNDVTFASALTATILCNNTNNLALKNITIDATSGYYGVQFTGVASNITIDSCIIRANPTITTTSTANITHACVYKNNTSAMAVSNLTITNSILDGGLCGVYLYGTTTTSCQNIVVENNTAINQSFYSIWMNNTNNSTISHNQITARSVNQGTQWHAIYLTNYSNGNIIGNRILANNSGITYLLSGMYFMLTSSMLIANNDIYLNSAATTTYGMHVSNCAGMNVIHNTIYTTKNTLESTTNRAFNYEGAGSGYSAVIKNNVFVADAIDISPTTYAIYFNLTAAALTSYGTNYNIDYNNYHSNGTNLAYVAEGNRVDLDAWKTVMETYSLDSHAVSMSPAFDNPLVDLNLLNYPDTLLCPSVQAVGTDIRNIARPSITAMGAYTQFVTGQDLMLMQFHEWSDEIVQNQTVPVQVVLRNIGTVPVSNAQLGWSVDNQNMGSVTWTALPVLNSLEDRVVYVGSFKATNPSSHDISVWIEEVNTEADSLNGNDTLHTTANLKPLAEWVTPMQDTIEELTFDINALIRQGTGVTSTPEITLISTVHETTTIYDTVSMSLNNGIWQATVPPQYYGTKVLYMLSLSDTAGNNITLIDSTYIRNTSDILGDTNVITLSLAALPTTGCLPDNTPIAVDVNNRGSISYDFTKDTVVFELEIIDPDTVKHTATVPFTGTLQQGVNTIELTPALSILHPGEYKIKIWLRSPVNNEIYIDTLRATYISGRIGLPIDKDFSDGFPIEFEVLGNNTSAAWKVSKGDSDVQPFFGDSLLSFTGNIGAMSTFATRQMDLSRTIQPSLSFWYFHDTIPCEDYTDVRMTVDGTDYKTLFSLTKYNPVYGWKQYSMDLDTHAINQCVKLVFEAMEKSRNGDVTQYIDRIRITAKRDVEMTAVLTSELDVCLLQEGEWKVVITNHTAPVLNYGDSPIDIVLEIKDAAGMQYIYSRSFQSGALSGFTSDTVTMSLPDFNFVKGTYQLKAYFTSVLDDTPQNDTLRTSLTVNPDITIRVHPESGGNSNCLSGETSIMQTVTIYNTGNMDLSDIGLILQVDTGTLLTNPYIILRDVYMGTILPGDSAVCRVGSAYTIPWSANFYAGVTAYLLCDSSLANGRHENTECVDTKDLYIVSIDNPVKDVIDNVGNSIPVAVTLRNRSEVNVFNSVLTVRITNSQGVQEELFTENQTTSTSETVRHTFTRSYTVPNDTVYYLTVFVDKQDNYSHNDTLIMKRYTEGVGVKSLKGADGFTLSQNTPNPANNRTRIDYSIPEAGEVIFHVYSVSGQLLYAETIEAVGGKQSLELNTSTFADGIYFYSIQYRGQRLVKYMSVQ
ncbi:MAG: right-handed parallel beta-helix repeat-containing protein [Bacteroidales bacterium]|jgi:hypothetical protein|nr:right-handed parallel beta-helix repeat-containing protein [Bacteroidales bacterium]